MIESRRGRKKSAVAVGGLQNSQKTQAIGDIPGRSHQERSPGWASFHAGLPAIAGPALYRRYRPSASGSAQLCFSAYSQLGQAAQTSRRSLISSVKLKIAGPTNSVFRMIFGS